MSLEIPKTTAGTAAKDGTSDSLTNLKTPARYDPLLNDIIRKETRLEVVEFFKIDGSGFSNEVVGVATSAGRLVLRTNVAQHLPKYKKEAWCLEQAHLAGIPVPRVLAFGVLDSKAYSIARYIEDSTKIDANVDQLRVWRALGRHMERLNSISTIGYGEEMHSPGEFNSTWQEVISNEVGIIFRDNYFEQSGTFSPQELESIKKRLERCGQIDAKPGVCHWDIGCGNARIRNGSSDEIFLLDLEFAIAAPVPHYQFACVGKGYGVSSQEMEAFKAGYGISPDQFAEILSDVKALIALKTLRSVRWAEDRRPEQLSSYSENARKTVISLLGEEVQLS